MTRRSSAGNPVKRRARVVFAAGCVSALVLAACNKAGGATADGSNSQPLSSTKSGAISMCALMPKEEVNLAIGTSYTKSEAVDDHHHSNCHYSTETDPTGVSLNVTWIEPGAYSNPAQHAAMQQAALGGAKLGGKLEEGIVPGAESPSSPLHVATGPVEGVGDEAMQNMLVLSARKGDYTLRVVINADMEKLARDSTEGPRVLEQEKILARAVLSKV